MNTLIPHYMNDEQAEAVGKILAEDLKLKRSKEHPDRWETENGTFTNKGIARRTVRIIRDALSDLKK